MRTTHSTFVYFFHIEEMKNMLTHNWVYCQLCRSYFANFVGTSKRTTLVLEYICSRLRTVNRMQICVWIRVFYFKSDGFIFQTNFIFLKVSKTHKVTSKKLTLCCVEPCFPSSWWLFLPKFECEQIKMPGLIQKERLINHKHELWVYCAFV